MAKKVTGYIKLQIPAGKATPAPPVGPALGQHGVNIVQFTKEFNARTADQGDLIIPVVITVYADRSFSFITKTPPAAVLLKKACGIKTAAANSKKEKVATIKKSEVQKRRRLRKASCGWSCICFCEQRPSRQMRFHRSRSHLKEKISKARVQSKRAYCKRTWANYRCACQIKVHRKDTAYQRAVKAQGQGKAQKCDGSLQSARC